MSVAFEIPEPCVCRDLRKLFTDEQPAPPEDTLQSQWQKEYAACIQYDERECRFTLRLQWLSEERPPNNFFSAKAQCLGLRDRLIKQGKFAAYDEVIRAFMKAPQSN